MRPLLQLFILASLFAGRAIAQAPNAPSSYVVPADFPSSIFPSYYYRAEPTRNPQPALYDPVLDETYPLSLTDPNTIPANDTDPPILPRPTREISDADATSLQQASVARIRHIAASQAGTNCTRCVASLHALQNLSMQAPEKVPHALVSTCEAFQWHSNRTCELDYGLYTTGSVWAQVIRYGDVGGLDGRYMCHSLSATTCPAPVVDPALDVSGLFPKEKPEAAKAPKASGERIKVAWKVLHMSDIHLDPRFGVGAEANCSDSLCCRFNNPEAAGDSMDNQTEIPAPLYGAYLCDSPYFLTTAAMRAAHPLTGTNCSDSSTKGPGKDSTLGWTIYTGDLVSHDEQNQLSRAYTEYTETSLYSQLQSLVQGPIFPVLGNHDSNPEAQDGPHSLPGPLGQQFSWNYDHVAGLWQNDGFIPADAAQQARAHYGGYSVKNQYGLRIITLNTDFWYRSNIFNNLHAANPDQSGMLHWLIDELQSAEDQEERVWIMGHVLTGWDGSNPTPNPTDLFYQIVDRYSPHVVANCFWGHTHEDEQMIYYTKNGTTRDTSAGLADALTPGWIGPSVTPLTNLNSGFRMYEVDTGSFDVYDAYTFYADVNSFPDINVLQSGPTYKFEYSTRDAYGPAAEWPADAPLNATFWHRVTQALEQQAMAGDLSLTETFNAYQGKMSVKSPRCDTVECALAKVCYIRSGSQALGQLCEKGFGSVQSAFTPGADSSS